MGMNLRAVAMLSLIACGGSSDEPKPVPGSGSAPGSASAPPTGIRIPVVAGITPISGNVALAIADDGVHLLGPITTADPGAHPAIGGVSLEVDDHGQLRSALPMGAVATAASLEAATSAAKVPPGHTILFAEPTRNVAAFDAIHAIGPSCTNLAVATNGHLAALPICFPKAMTGDNARVELVTKIAAAETLVILTRVDHTYVAHDVAELDGILAEQKASTDFHDRTDAAIAVDHDVTIGQVATAVAALRKAGFIDVQWRIEPEAPKPPPTPDVATRPAPTEASVTIDCERVDGGDLAAGARVVKAGIGLFRACFQKELAHGAHDGAADISFGVDNGKVTSVTIAGKVPSPAVAECTKTNIQRLVFPPGIRAVRCAFTYKRK